MIRNAFIVVSTALLLGACSTPPPLNFSPPNVGHIGQKVDAALVSTIVTMGRPDEAKGKIDVAGFEGEVAALWKSALEDAFTRMAIFDDDSKRRLNLAVKVLKLDVPGAGFDMKTSTVARYELIDRQTGDIVFTTDVASEGVVPLGNNFMGAIRARESASRSVQNNISLFLQQLMTADLTRPMFPTAPAAPAAPSK